MKTEHITHLIPEYLEGDLTDEQKINLKQHLKNCPACAKELEEYKAMLAVFDSEMEQEPHSSLRKGFYNQIEEEKLKFEDSSQTNSKNSRNQKYWFPKILKIAAGLALLVSSYFLGSYQKSMQTNKEIAMLKEKNISIRQTAMLSLMENKSASKRIQGVNYVEAFDRADEDILKALVDRMLYDENTNVRLTAVNALAGFTSSKMALKALIKALKSEKDPNIQITIIHTLVKLRNKKAVAPMKKLLEQKETEPFVKEQIRSLMPSII